MSSQSNLSSTVLLDSQPAQPMPAVQPAEVIFCENREVRLRVNGEIHDANLAFSCLVVPQSGDIVAVMEDTTQTKWVMGVLQRPGSQEMTLSFPGEVSFAAASGPIHIRSSENVSIAAADQLQCVSRRAVHTSPEAVVAYDDLVAKGKRLQASFKTILTVGQLLKTMAKQAFASVGSYIRRTEQLDDIQSGQMTRKTGGLFSVSSKHTVLISKRDTKIDGEHIHMG